MVEQSSVHLDSVFHALGDATRRRMLRELAQGERTVGQLAAPFDMSLAAASKHIKALESAGLVRREIRGRSHVCRLEPGPLAGAHQWLRFYEDFWNARLDVLEQLLRAEDGPTSPSPSPTQERIPPMNSSALPNAYGTLTEPATLTIQRLLPGPIERVWSYLTDEDLRRQWLAAGRMAPQVGSSVELVWRNDELTQPPGERPANFPSEHRMSSRVTNFNPPRKLGITWGEHGAVTFELEPRPDGVLLTVVHRRLPDRSTTLMVGAGWHMHLDLLLARLADQTPEPFWDGWSRLRAEYDQRVPS